MIVRICLCLLLFSNFGYADEPLDAQTGLVIAEGWQLARAHCGACHSYGLVTSNRGDRNAWRKRIRWMQAEHNLWSIPADDEASLLTYLSQAYAAPKPSRRAALAPHLMPKPVTASSR